MNSQRLVVILSCTALAFAAAAMFVKRPALVPKPAQEAHSQEAPKSSASLPVPKQVEVSEVPASVAKGFTWNEVESEDYKQYIARLRGVGCPEQTIRDIIIADVNKLYAPREAALKIKPVSVNAAQADEATAGDLSAEEFENRRKLREIQAEKRAVIKELLDVDLPLDLMPGTSKRAYEAFEVALKALPAEKREAAQQLLENYWAQSDAIKTRHGRKRTPEFVEEYRKVNEAYRTELAKLLTPAEQEEFEMRTSTTATKLGQRIANFSPTEEEFRQLYRLQRDFEEKNPRLNTEQANDAAARQARTDAASQLDNQIRATLGDDRFAEFKRSQDAAYQNLSRVGERYGLSRDTVLQAYELEKSFSGTPGPGIPLGGGQEEVQQFLAEQKARQKQINEAMIGVLGEKPARAYRRLRGGFVPPELEQ